MPTLFDSIESQMGVFGDPFHRVFAGDPSLYALISFRCFARLSWLPVLIHFIRWRWTQPWLLQDDCGQGTFRVRFPCRLQAVQWCRLAPQEAQLWKEHREPLRWNGAWRRNRCDASQRWRPPKWCSNQAQDDHEEEWSVLLRMLYFLLLFSSPRLK